MTTQQEDDIRYMRMALEEARKGMGWTNPNPMVGAVIVKDGHIISKGYHHRCGQGHAEVEAFRAAGDADVEGATIYVTLEPCSHYGKTPPCADLIVSKKVARVVVGALDPNPLVSGRGIRKIEAAGISVSTGVLARESRNLNEIFMHYITDKDPYVLYKSAMSLDGKIAAPGGQSQWISCQASRDEVQQLRNHYMAIMVGAQTVIDDDPRLTCRIEGGRNPVRVIVDSRLRVPVSAYVYRTARDVETIAACTQEAPQDRQKQLEALGVKVIRTQAVGGRTGLKELTRRLGQEGIDSILLEGGASLAWSAFREGIVDKVQFYIAPELIGGSTSRTPLGGDGIAALKDAIRLKDMQYRKSGDDLCVTALVDHEAAARQL